MKRIFFVQQEYGSGDTYLHFFPTQAESMTDSMQERYKKNPHGYHRLSMGTIWTDYDMDDDYLTDAVLAQDFGTELYNWAK